MAAARKAAQRTERDEWQDTQNGANAAGGAFQEDLEFYRRKYGSDYRQRNHNPEEQRKRALRHRESNEQVRRTRAMPRMLAVYAVVLMLFAALSALVYQRSIVAQIQREMLAANGTLSALSKQSDDYNLAISRNDNIYDIQRKANETMNMDYPTDDQINFVSLPPLPQVAEEEQQEQPIEPAYVRLWNLIIGTNNR